MDPSAFIFVGLALAWLAYLVPKALEHHDAGDRTRSVSTFSHKLRVLARREPVNRRQTRLVRTRRSTAEASPVPAAPDATAAHPDAPVDVVADLEVELEVEQTGFFAAQTFVRRSAASRAVRRRRRVLGSLLVLIAMVAAAAVGQVISGWWLLAPLALLGAWLYACRRMVNAERAVRRPVARAARAAQDPQAPRESVEDAPVADEPTMDAADLADTSEVPVVRADLAEPVGEGWELVPVTLPTYVSKPAAPRRTVTTIDLDSTGVWTSGRTAADSALAQQADAVRAPQQEGSEPQRRVSGA